MTEVGHQPQVLLAREQAVDRGELAGDADRGADGVGLARDVVAGDACLARIGLDQRREDVHGRGLAGAVRPEQGEDRAGLHAEVDAVKRDVVPNDFRRPETSARRVEVVRS